VKSTLRSSRPTPSVLRSTKRWAGGANDVRPDAGRGEPSRHPGTGWCLNEKTMRCVSNRADESRNLEGCLWPDPERVMSAARTDAQVPARL